MITLKTVDEYIDQLPEEKAGLVQIVRNLMLSLVPGIQEKLSFRIPFYHYYGMFSYLNATKNGVDVGFCRGRDLTDVFPQLQVKRRAIVATVTVRADKDIDTLQLEQIIIAAALWNEEAKRNKIPMVARRKSSTRLRGKM